MFVYIVIEFAGIIIYFLIGMESFSFFLKTKKIKRLRFMYNIGKHFMTHYFTQKNVSIVLSLRIIGTQPIIDGGILANSL